MSYEEADRCAEGETGGPAADSEGPDNAAILRELFRVGEANLARRLDAGGVHIELPEAHFSVDTEEKTISIKEISPYRSSEMVRECMLLAGEAAASWAAARQLPFPYISQETGDLPAKPLPGLAGSYQLRRCMRPRTILVKPGYHWGLGLDAYTQVTSPLRRYTDLLAHQQIRAFLAGGEVLDADETLLRFNAGAAAAGAVSQAERASKAHWLAVYLAGKKDSVWEGIVAEKRGNVMVVIIPSLALETQVAAKKSLEPNDSIKLILGQVRIPEAEISFFSS
jgi:exoribonuclease-2